MYLQHFGLSELPFSLTPDTAFYYGNPSHQEALDTLLLALQMGEGFIKVTGEVGTGKTLLCRKLLRELAAADHFVSAYIPNPAITPTALRFALADELGIGYQRNMGQHHVRLSQVIFAQPGQRNEVTNGLLGYVLPRQARRWPLPQHIRPTGELRAHISGVSHRIAAE